MKNTFLFDLDGTITDPGQGITNSVAYALEKYGITVSDKTKLYSFIGPPLDESFEKYYGFSHEQAWEAIKYYREYYSPKGIYECELYDGIIEVFEGLKKHGAKIVIATSKPEIFAKQLMEHFKISEYFDFIAGSELNGGRIKKADVIKRALTETKANENACVMTGDREHDIFGAKAFGITSIGVLYGYGTREELEKAGADSICETTDELASTCEGMFSE